MLKVSGPKELEHPVDLQDSMLTHFLLIGTRLFDSPLMASAQRHSQLKGTCCLLI